MADRDNVPERCGVINHFLGWPMACDREPGHKGSHRGYNEQIDEAMFWDTGKKPSTTTARPGADVGPDIAVDKDGRRLPAKPGQVRRFIDRAIDEGEILAVVIKTPKGDLAVPCMGPPSIEVLEALQAAAQAYGKAIGH